MGDCFMHNLIAEVKLQFSNNCGNKYTENTIIISWDTDIWLELFKLLTEKYIFSDFKRHAIVTMLFFFLKYILGRLVLDQDYPVLGSIET